MHVRPESPADDDVVRQIHERAFGDQGGRVAALVDDLRPTMTPTRGVALVAEEGRVVGHTMCSPAVLDAPSRLVEVLVLSPLGVDPAFRGRGAGSALVQRALVDAARQDAPLLFIEGDPRYYGRFGFRPGAELGLRKPSLRIPDRAFQVVALPGFEPWMTGTLVYPDPFWRHDLVGLRDV